MTIKRKVLSFLTALFIFIVAFGGYIVWQTKQTSNQFKNTVPNAANQIADTAYLNSLAQMIRYYDEVLTQSARNYAFTSDIAWKNRYETAAPKLDEIIHQAITQGDSVDNQTFEGINQANLALVDMETQSMDLVQSGQATEAQAILNGSQYAAQKKIYKDGIDAYLATKDATAGQAIRVSTDSIKQVDNQISRSAYRNLWLMIAFMTLVLVLIFIFYYTINRTILAPIKKLSQASEVIAAGDFKHKITLRNHDEVGHLAESFNSMTAKLADLYKTLDSRVKQRTKELVKSEVELKAALENAEQANRLMVGRELKMIELKERLEKLKKA